MIQHILNSSTDVANAASVHAANLIRDAIAERGAARIVVATGNSQLDFLARLIVQPNIDWSKVVLFHLDEYLGIPPEHPASMARYVRERFADPVGITERFLLDGISQTTWMHAAAALSARADVAFTGIGENGHLAFNEPPADFDTEEPFIIVNLAQETRDRQVGTGRFDSLEEVPLQAVTMSIRQILKAAAIICIATGPRKASAVARCFEAEIGPSAPASALRLHGRATLYLDSQAAALMTAR